MLNSPDQLLTRQLKCYPTHIRARRLSGARLLQVELEVLDVGEAHLLQLAGAAATVLEVHLLERFGRDLPQPLVSGALLLGVEETGGVLRRQRHGEVAEPVLVSRTDRRG